MYEDFLPTAKLNALQLTLGYEERAVAAGHLADQINQRLGADGVETPEGADPAALARLAGDGYAVLGPVLAPERVAETVAYFKERPCFNFHVACRSDGIGRYVGKDANRFAFGSYKLEEVARAPHLLELANDPAILALAAAYLGCTPTLYSLNAWWSFAGRASDTGLTQSFHRDRDDFKFCTLFVYLTDAAEGRGAQEYIRGSHDPDVLRAHLETTSFPLVEIVEDDKTEVVRLRFDDLFGGAGYRGDPVYEALFAKRIERIEGPAGTGFVIDPSGLHRGVPPTDGDRLMFWARYGIYRNVAYHADELAPVAVPGLWSRLTDSPRARYINRLVVAPAAD